MNVVNTVQQFLASHEALGSRFIVAVSGGKDSMALLHMCTSLNLDITVAHCNFMLRGDASIQDEAFVTEYCHANNIAVETTRFDTGKRSEEWGLSTQETARKLRYDWFGELMNKYHAKHTLTAHHANDVAETFFLNLLRGSGLKGLRSIPPVNGFVMRPLIHTGLQEIEAYIKTMRIPYREDASNQTDAYKRNYIRHHIIPLLEEVNEQAVGHIVHTTELLSDSYQLLAQEIRQLKDAYTETTTDSLIVDLERVSGHPQKQLLLFEWLNPLGFNASVVSSILQSELLTGNKWLSSTHTALYNRGKLVVKATQALEIPERILTHWPETIRFGAHTYLISEEENMPVHYRSGTLYLDKQKVGFPLKLRTWKQGDSFQPLGMNGAKKASDFFIDSKISQAEKEQAMVIEGPDGIVAIAPYRIADPYKLTSATSRVVSLTLTR